MASGFLVFWRQPLLLLTWSLMWLAFEGAVGAAAYFILGPKDLYQRAIDIEARGDALLLPLVRDLGLVPLSALIFAIGMCSVVRAVAEPRPGLPHYLRLGGDELRLAAGLIGFFAFFELLPLMTNWLARTSTELPAVYGLELAWHIVLAVAPTLLLLAAVSLTVSRLWLLPADLVITHQLDWSKLWKLGRGRVTRVYGTFLLALVLGLVVAFLGDVVSEALTSSRFVGEALSEVLRTTYDRQSPLEPQFWISRAWSAPFQAVSMAVMLAPAVYVRRRFEPDYASVF